MGNSRKALVLALIVLTPALFGGVLLSGQAEGLSLTPIPNVGWQKGTIESGGVGQYPSVSVDSDGHVHMSYYDYTHNRIRYASDETGVWAEQYVDAATNVGQYSSIATDAHGKSHISYLDSTNNDLKYATNADGTWKNMTVDHVGVVGEFTSIAVGSDDSVYISYYDLGNRSLKCAHLAGSTWTTETVDDPAEEVGEYTSIALDSAGLPHIAYFDTTNHCLKYAVKTSAGSWTTSSLASVTTGAAGQSSLVMNLNGMPWIAYTLSTNHVAYAAHLDGTWTSAPLTGTPAANARVSMAVDEYGKMYLAFMNYTTGVLVQAENDTLGAWSYSIVDPTPGSGSYLSIAVDENAKSHIAYLDGGTGSLRYATDAGASWYVNPVDDTGDRGDVNSVATDPLGGIHVVYRDAATNDLLYAEKYPSSSWTMSTIDSSHGVPASHYASIAVDANGKAYVVYFNSTALKCATNVLGSWHISTIDDADSPEEATIVLDALNHCHVFYTTSSPDRLMYANNTLEFWALSVILTETVSSAPSAVLSPNGTFSLVYQTDTSINCTTGKAGSWTTSVIQSDPVDYGGHNSLALDSNGHLQVVFSMKYTDTLWYATNDSGAWICEMLEEAYNGDWCSIGVGPDNVLQIGYFWDNTMRFLTNPEGIWMKQTVVTGAGAVGYGSMVLTSTGRAIASYYDYTMPGRLIVAQRITVPTTPIGLTAARGDSHVQLDWTAPADNGGSAVTSYVIYRGNAADNMSMVARVHLLNSYLDTGLTNGVKYFYAVKAANLEGASIRPALANATPATVPDRPLNLVTAPGDGQVKLSWDVPSFNGGAPITQYRVYRGTDSTNLTYVGNTTGTTYTDGGLQNDKTYYYKVTAVNDMGEGALSDIGQATPKFDSTLLIVFIAVIAIVAAGLVVFMFVRRRR